MLVAPEWREPTSVETMSLPLQRRNVKEEEEEEEEMDHDQKDSTRKDGESEAVGRCGMLWW